MAHSIKPRCDPTEIALKSFFLGPRSENAEWLAQNFTHLLERWFEWRRRAFPQDGSAIGGSDQASAEFQACQQRVSELLLDLIGRFESELPKYSPRYVGHMFSELSMPAILGHVLTLLHNPNIIARETATVAAQIENEAIEALGQMMGQRRTHGHFTSGGTAANFEAVVRASARLHTWLAAGAVANKAGEGPSLFESSHLGWERYRNLRQASCEPAAQRDLRDYLPELVGHAAATRAIEETFGVDYRGPVLVVPCTAHYSWKKAARLFGIGDANMLTVEQDRGGRYRVDQLRQILADCHRLSRPVLAVVSVAGSTETGSIDPIDEIDRVLADHRKESGWHIWHHVDAAYGGFFASMLRPRAGFDGSRVESVLSPAARSALEAIGRAESVTIDPHKLGYVPYASGAFLAIDARDYTCVEILAPYLDYQKDNLAPTVSHPYSDRGPYTLEGSRSGAGAVATWLTARSIGLDQSGYGLLLARTISQKRKVERWLTDHLSSARVYRGCDTNVLCFCVADQGEPISATNQRTLRIMTRLAEASAYFVSKTELPLEGRHSSVPRQFAAIWSAQIDHGHLTMLRMCLMNPFFDSSELDTDHIQSLVFSLCELAD